MLSLCVCDLCCICVTGPVPLAPCSSYLVLGYAIKSGSGAHVIAYLAAWHAVAGVLVLVLLRRLRAAAPELVQGQVSDATPDARSGEPPSKPSFVQLLLDGPRTLAHLERRARLLLCAFVCLFFTVLSPSGLLTASLRSRGTSAHALALFRAAAQLAGAAGTAVAPRLIARRGPIEAGLLLQRAQLACVCVATAACVCPLQLWPTVGRLVPSRELVVMGGVAASRVGLWGFDLCERQALQTAAASECGGSGGGAAGGGRRMVALFATEKALSELAGLAMLALSLVLPDVDSFGVLAALSLLAVACAAGLVSRSRATATTASVQRNVSGRTRRSTPLVATSSPPYTSAPYSVDIDIKETSMLTARGASLRFHALFAPVAAICLGACARSAPGAVGMAVGALLAAWHLSIVAIATSLSYDGGAQLWALYRFASIVSVFQVLPDAFLVVVLRTLSFSDTSVPRLVAGSVPLYMAAMWSLPLLWVLLACSPPPSPQNLAKPNPSKPPPSEQRNGTRASELALAATLALVLFGGAEFILTMPWHSLQLWSATASKRVLGHVAVYVLPAEAALGGAVLVAHRATQTADGWGGSLKRVLAGAAVAIFYTGALCLSYLLIEAPLPGVLSVESRSI